jgi:hypothetical protein
VLAVGNSMPLQTLSSLFMCAYNSCHYHATEPHKASDTSNLTEDPIGDDVFNRRPRPRNRYIVLS